MTANDEGPQRAASVFFVAGADEVQVHVPGVDSTVLRPGDDWTWEATDRVGQRIRVTYRGPQQPDPPLAVEAIMAELAAMGAPADRASALRIMRAYSRAGDE